MTIRWRGILTLSNHESPDHRVLENVTWRELPLTLRIQTEDFGAHDGASPVATIDLIEPRAIEAVAELGFTVPEGALPLYAEGTFSESEPGQLAAQWVGERVLRGVSVDPGAIEYVEELIDPASGEVVTMDQIYEVWDQIDAAEILDDEEEVARLIGWLESLYYRVRFTSYEIAAATLVATPAFGEAVIEIFESEAAPAGGGDVEAAAANSATARDRLASLGLGGRSSVRQRLAALAGRPEGTPGRMVASGAPAPRLAIPAPAAEPGARQASAPAIFPARSFARQPLDRLTPFTIDRTGRMSGHLFARGSCHRSFTNRCVSPDDLMTDPDFRDFHVGSAHLDDGSSIRVGVLTHADLHAGDAQGLSPEQLTRLMEDTGQQLGPVRLWADEFGLQACGQLYDDVSPTMAARALAGFPSYDARQVAGRWKLFGLHVVNTPGHTVYEEHDGEVTRLVASASPIEGPHAAAARAALAAEGEPSCGCGGHDPDGCGCSSPKLSAAALLALAQLDETMASRARLARSRG